MKISAVKIYQAIKVDGQTHTWLNVKNHNAEQDRIGGKNHYVVTESDRGVLVKTNNSCVLCTWNNIAYVEYELSDEQEPTPKKSKEK